MTQDKYVKVEKKESKQKELQYYQYNVESSANLK